MWTLGIAGTLLDDLNTVLTELAGGGGTAPAMAGLFLVYILITSLTVLNMLIGVLCEVVGAVATAEKERMAIEYVKEKLLVEVDAVKREKISNSGEGKISKAEFLALIRRTSVQ